MSDEEMILCNRKIIKYFLIFAFTVKFAILKHFIWTETARLFRKFYHNSLLAWKMNIFELDKLRISSEVAGVQNYFTTAVKACDTAETLLVCAKVADHHEAVPTVVVALQHD